MGLLWRRNLASAYGPNRLVSDHDLVPIPAQSEEVLLRAIALMPVTYQLLQLPMTTTI